MSDSMNGVSDKPTAETKEKGKTYSRYQSHKEPNERRYTPEEIQAFDEGRKILADWGDDELSEKHLKLIQWIDRDHFRGEKLQQRWSDEGYRGKGEKLISHTVLNRWYNERAEKFYAKKGLVWVPLRKRRDRNTKISVQSKSTLLVPKRTSDRSGAIPRPQEKTKGRFRKRTSFEKLDLKLLNLFSKTVKPTAIIVNLSAKRKLQSDINRYHANQQSIHAISFRRKDGDAPRGHPSRPLLRRDSAVRYCTSLRDMLKANPHTNTIVYGEDIDQITVRRFIACVSPSIRAGLPIHDLVEIVENSHKTIMSTQIQWSMQELQDLYIFSHHMGASDVCDMVIDRWHEELHRPTVRMLCTELGSIEAFNILGFEPAFLNYLAEHDHKGFDFLIEVLVIKGEEGWKLLSTYGLSSWSEEVKTAVIEKLESVDPVSVSINDTDAICQGYHHHHEHGGKCYRVQATAAPLATYPTTPVTHSKRVNFFNKYPQPVAPGNTRRWEIQRAFSEKEQEIKNKRKRRRNEDIPELDSDAHIQKKLKEFYEDSDDRGPYNRAEDPDDSDDDTHELSISLPDEYNDSRYYFSADSETYEDGNFTPRYTTFVQVENDRIRYNGKGMNGTKDGKGVAYKKMALVEERLALFRAHGYDVDGMHVELPDEEDAGNYDE
ncbi:uncharacterized protein K460DRAFT_397516 [Cucurbitaria berberidis CBS 394.84]|uniref:Uncharacterized protein n=1 Tax=Cucurbitaria berberidis CBS 394.84 TaxID=1168544 RepID=A0A9P4L715_9PLEO|nr:uncharacterized protein K460DRAFT_397516 [Cucurbitaria berberidis CBS 394.84]KAF1844415.1 hypothetical protein K460DRAFT_397516 [Cucurbitaria berberidis CBS 394.84]